MVVGFTSSRYQLRDSILSAMRKKDYCGGTLVEYVSGSDFQEEGRRDLITFTQIEHSRMLVLTNGNPGLDIRDPKDWYIVGNGRGVLYLSDSLNLKGYALAENGSKIPLPHERKERISYK